MKFLVKNLLCGIACLLALQDARALTGTLKSPDHRLEVRWKIDCGLLSYEIAALDGASGPVTVLEPSPLGIRRADTDFTAGLRLASVGPERKIDETYTLVTGKQRQLSHKGVEQTLHLLNTADEPFTVTFHVTETYAAFRYGFPAASVSELVIHGESTGFKLPVPGEAWMLPYDKVDVWAPSYEAAWKNRIPIGTASDASSAGWAFPALFHANHHWVLLSEAGMDGTSYASHLEAEAPGGLYRIRLPEETETYGVAPQAAHARAPWLSPWRVVVTGSTLAPLVGTSAITDLSAPSELGDSSWVKPGRVSWSWWSDKGSPSDYNRLVPFIDLSSDFKWEYSLLDLGWENMRRGSIEKITRYAKDSNVGLILWYNSGGAHNRVEGGIRDVMHDPVKRKTEMARLSALGIKGLKIDFMQSDKQYLMQLYIDILRDAATHHLFVDFHGATIPRGWSRTFPNLLTMEAVRGVEQYWDPNYARDSAMFNTIYCFTRNVVGSMDFTPVIFGDAPELQRHQTTNAHELALSVAFESGLQHFVDSVSAYRTQPDFVQGFLSTVPVVWDETRYLDGVPGELALLARRHGDDWYVACLNGEAVAKDIRVPLDFLGADKAEAHWIHDGETQYAFAETKGRVGSADHITLRVAPKGGFVGHLKTK